MKKNNSKENNKIRFENEEEGPIQIVLNKKEKVMEEKPLVGDVGEKEEGEGVGVKDKDKSVEGKDKGNEEENKDKPFHTPTTTSPTHHTTTPSHTTTPTPTTEQITPLEKVTAFATAIVKAITDGLIKVFVWITDLFKRRRREENEGEIGEEMREEIKEGVKEEKV